jgi:outer membrane protein OmpA-like peptidoglycan-associated protein
MEKTEACAILRIPTEASRSEVEAAFRKRMREVRARFDAARGMSLRMQYQREFAALRDAQDSLLSELEEPPRKEPAIDEPPFHEPRLDEPKINQSRVDEPKIDEAPVNDESLVHGPRLDESKADELRADQPKSDQAERDKLPVDQAGIDEAEVNELPVDQPKVDEAQAGELLVHDSRVNQGPAEEPGVVEQPVALPIDGHTGSPGPTISIPEQLRPGQLFMSRFELQRELETGNTGTVWLVQDHVLQMQVALIFLPGLISSDKAAVEDLRNEIRRRAALNHSHVPRIFDLVEDKGRVAIEIEYPAGRSLSELRFGRPNHVFEVGELKTWVKELCEAKDPNQRPQSAIEVARRLEDPIPPSDIASQPPPLPLTLPPPPPPSPPLAVATRKPWLTIVGAISILVILAVGAFLALPYLIGPKPGKSEFAGRESSSPVATPFPTASATPSPEASTTPSPQVSATPSPQPSPSETVTPNESQSPSPSPTQLSQQDIDATKEEAIRRIDALPGISAEVKAHMIEKLDRARSMERLAFIPFDIGQTTLHRAAADELVKTFDSPEVRDKLSDPTIVLVVAGYADIGGRANLNLRISQERAEHVTRILRERAKLLNAMQTIGMGGTELLDGKRPDQNRAVEVWAVVPF